MEFCEEEDNGYECDDEEQIHFNKYTLGKYFKQIKGIGYPEKEFKTVKQLPENIEKYLEWFKSYGGKINKVQLSEFYLKNGLPYQGIIATEKIGKNEELMQVPAQLLMSTWIALNIPQLKPVYFRYQKFFSWDSEDL